MHMQNQLTVLLDQATATVILQYILITSKASMPLFVLPKIPSWISGLHQQLTRPSD